MNFVAYAVTAIAAYLLGSIPTGYLVGKAKGVDIRKVGSGNIGATNVFRFLGKTAGIFVLLADAYKGWLACSLGRRFILKVMLGGEDILEGERFPVNLEALDVLGGVCAILGHNYTCWLQFKGGKGIATTAGVLVALVPQALLAGLAVWIVVFAIGRYVSLASIVAAAVLPFAVWLTRGTPTLIVITACLGVLAIYRHKSNIQRLLNGTENRLGSKKPQNETTT